MRSVGAPRGLVSIIPLLTITCHADDDDYSDLGDLDDLDGDSDSSIDAALEAEIAAELGEL